MIATATSSRLNNLKRKRRLHGPGATSFSCKIHVKTISQKKLKSVQPGWKKDIYKGVFDPCTHSITYAHKDIKKETRKMRNKELKGIDRVKGSLPVVWHPRHPDTFQELTHSVDLRHLVDLYSVDASSSIAAARYMHMLVNGKKDETRSSLKMMTVFCANEAHEQHVLRLLDEEYLDLMRNTESDIYQGDDFKQLIDEHFGPPKATKDEDELSGDSDKGDDSEAASEDE